MVTIRSETSADHVAVYRVNQQAFSQTGEADLVDQLRQAAQPYVSLVAEEETGIVGHIFFTPVEIESDANPVRVMGLAPMAVLPCRQRQGVGSILVRAGLLECRRRGIQAIVVLGHPEYYPRFGFQPADKFGLRSEYDAPSEAFMALELVRGTLEEVVGVVKYHPLFASVT